MSKVLSDFLICCKSLESSVLYGGNWISFELCRERGAGRWVGGGSAGIKAREGKTGIKERAGTENIR